jgi:hypothetical protein
MNNTKEPTSNRRSKNEIRRRLREVISDSNFYNDYKSKNRFNKPFYVDHLLANDSIIDALLEASDASNIGPEALWASIMHEGFDKWVAEQGPGMITGVSGFHHLGLDHFVERAPDLIRRGFLPKGFEQNYMPRKRTNEKGEEVRAPEFLSIFAAFRAKAADMAARVDTLKRDAERLGVNLSKDGEEFFTHVYYNMGEGGGRRMLSSYQEKGFLENDDYLNERPNASWAQPYNHAQNRIQNSRSIRDLEIFAPKEETEQRPTIDPVDKIEPKGLVVPESRLDKRNAQREQEAPREREEVKTFSAKGLQKAPTQNREIPGVRQMESMARQEESAPDLQRMPTPERSPTAVNRLGRAAVPEVKNPRRTEQPVQEEVAPEKDVDIQIIDGEIVVTGRRQNSKMQPRPLKKLGLGGDIGTAGGAAVGQALIPIPGVGGVIGGFVGGQVGGVIDNFFSKGRRRREAALAEERMMDGARNRLAGATTESFSTTGVSDYRTGGAITDPPRRDLSVPASSTRVTDPRLPQQYHPGITRTLDASSGLPHKKPTIEATTASANLPSRGRGFAARVAANMDPRVEAGPFMDRLTPQQRNSAEFALQSVWNQAGRPTLRHSEEKLDRAKFDPLTNTIDYHGIEDLVAELAHGLQRSNGDMRLLRMLSSAPKTLLQEGLSSLTGQKHNTRYSEPGQVEWDAHSIIEEDIKDKLLAAAEGPAANAERVFNVPFTGKESDLLGGGYTSMGTFNRRLGDFFGRDKKRTGGTVPIGQDAVEFVGPSHEKGGIRIGNNVEVEGGETMDFLMKGGKVTNARGGTPYVFSDALKVPGTNLSFANYHKSLVKRGADENQILSLANTQEVASGRKKGANQQTLREGGFFNAIGNRAKQGLAWGKSDEGKDFLTSNVGNFLNIGVAALNKPKRQDPALITPTKVSDRSLAPIQQMDTTVNVAGELAQNQASFRNVAMNPNMGVNAMLASHGSAMENTGQIMEGKRRTEMGLNNQRSGALSQAMGQIDSVNAQVQAGADQFNARLNMIADENFAQDKAARTNMMMRGVTGMAETHQARRLEQEAMEMEPLRIAALLSGMDADARNKWLGDMATKAKPGSRLHQILLQLGPNVLNPEERRALGLEPTPQGRLITPEGPYVNPDNYRLG